ncbi:MAG: acyl-CoA dehydrogenase family protein [Bacteriovoracaceae bacterium]|jgi:alkylation response protein AidB-like acyl-CoA dehydrogenase|nr:acyl-CoA dehydrogenase family protein [Bacteriovoracaceae bacterium]
MANYYSDSSEWKWLFKNAIDWDKIIPLYYPSFPTEDGFNNNEDVINFIEDMITATGDWTANAVAGRAKILDQKGAGELKDGVTIPGEQLQAFYNEAVELGVTGMCAETQFGGMGAPVMANLLAFTQMNRACVSSATQLGFFTSMIDMLERFAEHEDAARLIPKVIAGQISGSMCLTEPGAGSDLGSIKTTATKQDDGTYLLNGTKMFITNGGGGFGFVLAKVKDAPEGLAGISMFLCEQHIDGNLNYRVTNNEHKMGLHGSFTCEIVYENSKAKLIGKENHGFRYMLHLMNEARIAVGLQCVGGLEATIGYAKNYAKERVQFGKNLMEHPLYARNMGDWETERDAFRALMVDTISYFDQYQKLDLMKRRGELTKEQEAQLALAKKWVRRRTPLVKMYGAETFTFLSQRGIQALGGYGFIEEYDAARFHRDSFATLLYEGTSQIQSLMAMKDLMKFIMRNPTKYFTGLVNANPIANFFGASCESESKFNAAQYTFKKSFVKLLIKTLKPETNTDNPSELMKFFNAKEWLKEENVSKLMIHAETITQALAYIETLRVLMEHAKIDNSREDLFNRYYKLVAPRFAAIYEDWKNW